MTRILFVKNMWKCIMFMMLVPVFANASVCYEGPSGKHDSIEQSGTENQKTRNGVPDSLAKFSLVSSSHMGVAADYTKPLQLTFNQDVDENKLKNIIITKGGADREPIGADTKILSGKWVLSSTPRKIVFKPAQKFKPGMFVSITIPETFKSLSGVGFTGGKDLISFIMDNGEKKGQRTTKIDTLKVVDNNLIPLMISVPNTAEKHPVMIFIHGGGWSGGKPALSSASLPSGHTASYLCDKLGVAVVGVGYRCTGSNGSFAKAKADIEDAVKYVKKHAAEYNLDLSRLGICGESAGSPLSAIIAQQDKDIKYYIGWNGIYDFVNDNDGEFGQGNGYGQEEPSAEANSALFHIRRPSPPITLLIHGTNDLTINYRQSVAFDKAIKDAGGYSKLILFEGQPHWSYYAPRGKYELSTLYQIKDFLIKKMDLKVK
ncbi:MAG: prolyl oligopeptidase family serine peptidase [Bacteroidota bacterium]|nr:prolyl oligopeptidase family serine peptidase [Bacteroidota bacterium]